MDYDRTSNMLCLLETNCIGTMRNLIQGSMLMSSVLHSPFVPKDQCLLLYVIYVFMPFDGILFLLSKKDGKSICYL
jgi:hypothetical protein